ncbi:accessory regulator B [Enterococcus sp. AZ194]|uniref:accessory gene regulator AgrB n=1 Tax=Enterococcus sp. AZ194 TaxID=2774629 RepID=UPI003F21F452
MDETEYDYTCYFIEIVLLNLFKMTQIYLAAYLLGTMLETAIMNGAYILLRHHAGGWHARTSIGCSIFGIVTFVGIPRLLQESALVIPGWSLTVLSICCLVGVLFYAPADTEKNPLINAEHRKRKAILSFITVITMLSLSFLLLTNYFQILIILGLSLETLLISPLYYKLTKRSYNNYENYQKVL